MVSSVVEDRSPWVFKRFVKEKFFVRERYWQHLDLSRFHQQELVIPDGMAWRKYLKLMMFLSERCNLVCLESAVELMDWRNSAPCLQGERQESTATQERVRIRKLIESGKVAPLCDLSMREAECDEFDLFEFAQLDVESRSMQALLRAGRMLGEVGSVFLMVAEENTLGMDKDRDGLRVLSVKDLVEHMVENQILDESSYTDAKMLILNCEQDYERRNTPKAEAGVENFEHLSEEEVKLGLSEGTLLQGRLEVSGQNSKEAFVSTRKGKIFIDGNLGHFNRSFHQDVVAVRPLPETEWGRPMGRRRLIHQSDSDDSPAELRGEGPLVPSAVVVAISHQGRRRYVATLVDTPNADERAVLVVPMSTRIPKIRIQTKSWKGFVGQRLLVDIDHWELSSVYPHGHCVEILGPVGDLETEVNCLLEEHCIRLKEFSASAVACLPPGGRDWQVSAQDTRGRRDLRNSHRIFSVDPPGCQDIDDTMHARVLPNGDVEVGVHIADVTHFVQHNSALDLEAQVRGTTFYLVDRRFDMLPSLLSSDLCSLHGQVDRLAVSAIWVLSSDFEQVKSCWFGRTVIHNCQAMTYGQAHNILHDQPPDDPSKPPPPPLTAGAPVDPKLIPSLKEDLSILTRLARKLRKDREEIGGAVDLSSGDIGSELKFELDANGNPVKVSSKHDMEIHHTIAEMMILANQSVAEKIYKSFPQSALLRVHGPVEQNRFDDLQVALATGGIAFDGSSNMALAKSLEGAKQKGPNSNVVNSLWQSLATRAMSEAIYISTGSSEDGRSLSHYGLGIDKYTHFTSPIRRYADVVVHKQLLATLHNDTVTLSKSAPPGFPQRKALDSMPVSSAISILRGQGLKSNGETNDSEDMLVDPLINQTSDMRISKDDSSPRLVKVAEASAEVTPYLGSEVSKICEGLNQQNRMAKLSSMACQKLFLSLYFSDSTECAQAVVTDLRINGLIVYVPKFDMKGPVYLTDVNGDVQIDPTFVGLREDAGLPASLGFTHAPQNRRFPSGSTRLIEGDTPSLELKVSEAKEMLVFRALDVVNVRISCDLSDIRARIPTPRLYLVRSAHGAAKVSVVKPRSLTSAMIVQNHSQDQHNVLFEATQTSSALVSIYDQINSIEIVPSLNFQRPPDQSRPKTAHASTIAGRKIFSKFINPDTRGAQQEAAVSAAAADATSRRAAAAEMGARRTEFETTRNIERSVMARTQRLAASKRNTKRSKAK